MHSKDTPDCLLFALFILILSPILCEIIDINDLKLHNNNVLNVFNFYWKATEFNTSKMNSFKYNLTIKNIDLPHKGVFHLFAISPQLFKYINVLYEPGFCCFDNYIGFCTPAGNQTNSQEIINQSSYYRNISLTSNNTWIMEDHLNTSIEGIHSTYIAFCSSETTKMQITLQGEMIYSTVTGYLSSENYFIIYLYVSIVVYLLIIALIWISLAIKNNKIQRIPCFKLYSLSILIIISNKLLHIILLLMQNQKGKLMLQISIINNLLNVIGNVIYRILIYAVSLGYTLNSHLKLYKEEEKIFTFFNQNKILKMNLLLVFYSVGFFLFETTVIYYTYFHLCVIYPVMNLTLMMISNFFFMTQSCKRINKKLNLASSTIIKVR